MAIRKKTSPTSAKKKNVPAKKATAKKTVATKQPVKKTLANKTVSSPKIEDTLLLKSPFWNIWDDGKQYKVRVSIPGLTKRNIKVEVNGNLLTVSSEKSTKRNKTDKNYIIREYNYSSWSKSIAFPQIIDAKSVKVSDKDGVLKINLSKA